MRFTSTRTLLFPSSSLTSSVVKSFFLVLNVLLFSSSAAAVGIVKNNHTSLNDLIASDSATASMLSGLSFSNKLMSLYTLAITRYTAVPDISIALWMSNWQESVKDVQTAYSQPPTLCNNTYVGGLKVDPVYRSCSRNETGDAYLWGVSKVLGNGTNFELTLTHQMQFTGKNFTLFFSAYYNVTTSMLTDCDPTNRARPLDTPPVPASKGKSCTSELKVHSTDIDIFNVYYKIP
ncbi:MAG: hypothetical protein M1814_004003 [Vezdaea aestivalis]|nr:MAG: hypothetical protein M1814_004003 [Vezdaea aestivalis]